MLDTNRARDSDLQAARQIRLDATPLIDRLDQPGDKLVVELPPRFVLTPHRRVLRKPVDERQQTPAPRPLDLAA